MASSTLNQSVHLTPRQRQILEAISASQQTRGCSPTMAELAGGLSLSRSTVFEHMSELREKGLLSICPGKARSSRLTSLGQERLSEINDSSCDVDRVSQESGVIPLRGRVAAGVPMEAIETQESLSLHGMFGSDQSLFSLQVKGDSMIDENIHSGDYVICRRACVARDGELVVAIVDDEEATLKRFYREKDRVRLQPANSAYEPIYSDNCRIEATVVGLLRQF
ncbi:MAG: transcriptional repressor LexA [Phycisphaeraceae bacterium]|nr:transcriptional repressor LexA [Phycisphaeraceae bacterium]